MTDQKCPVNGCKGTKLNGGDLCANCQKRWDDAIATLSIITETRTEGDTMTREERYREALERIARFSHHPDCTSSAPIYECGCFTESQQDIAQKALEEQG